MKCTVKNDFPQALSVREQVQHKKGDVIEVPEHKVESWVAAGHIEEGKAPKETTDPEIEPEPSNDEDHSWMSMNKDELDVYAEEKHDIKLKRSMSLENMQKSFEEELAKKVSE